MGPIETCLTRARRRSTGLLVFRESAVALAIAAAGLVLLLLTGTQVLNWYWLALLLVAGLAIGGYRAWNGVPSRYVLAQRIDHALDLRDALSTAHHFESDTSQCARAQREGAERAAREADLSVALPLNFHRAHFVAGVLLLSAAGLLGVRYGLLHTLDLSAPLVALSFDDIRFDRRADSKQPEQRRPDDPVRAMAMPLEPETQVDLGQAPDSALSTVDVPDVVNQELPDNNAQVQDKLSQVALEAGGKDQSRDVDENGKPSDGGAPTPGPDSGNTPAQQGRTPDTRNQNDENSSLFDKMRDAMANLMSRLKVQPQQGGDQQQMAASKDGQNSGQSRERTDQQGKPQPGSQQPGESSQADPNGEQQGEGGERGENGDSKQMANGSDQQAAKDAKSGVGKQDGNKDTNISEQLEAMGKLTEIFGKRAANVSGEAMVEVASGKQQLRTPYSQRQATHTAAGGEVRRDQVPLAYQAYVQKYFEQVHRAAAAGKAAPAEKKTP